MSTTNHYFNNYGAIGEQRLVEDLIVESIKIMGFTAYYIPISNPQERDILYGEDPLKKFNSAFPIEMYLSSALQYDGDRDFFSKFGLEVRNEASVIVSKRSYAQRVPQTAVANRPREGDLVYIPVINGVGNLFEITFTDHTKDFFMLGRRAPYFYELKLEQYRFSQEVIDTGVDEIDDQIFDSYKRASLPLANTTVFPAGTGSFIPGEIIYQGASLATANAQAIVYSYVAHSSVNIIRVQGSFVTGNVRGNTSNALRSAITYNDDTQVGNSIFEDIADNVRIETEADGILDFTEHNPFGEA